MMKTSVSSIALLLVAFIANAQTPNTATIVVDVVDQAGAAVRNAKIAVVNTATGATRDVTSGRDGTVTIPALSLTGAYSVFVSKEGFGNEERRATTFTLDGANNDEAWGRQTMIATVPLGAVQEVTLLSNAFSAEYGWTSGPALNIVTKSGTNALRGEGLFMIRPGDWQAKTFS